MTPDPAGLGMFMIHAGLVIGVAANLVVLIRFIRNGKDKR